MVQEQEQSGDLYTICGSLLEDKWVSDIHITVGDPVRSRRSGALKQCSDYKITDLMVRSFLAKLNTDLKDPERAIKTAEKNRGDGDARNGYDFTASIDVIRCRCNLSLANGGCISIVLRRLSDEIPEFSTLGLPESVLKQIIRPTGLVLVTGPTGSGKSTTLAAMLDYINSNYDKHILTIEDPVEYLVEPKRCKITRKEIGTDAPSFLSALRAAVRQDPDIIMVGEVRDLGTIRASLSAAETGHLVFATLHTNSAAKTIDRIGSFFPPEEKTWAYAVLSSVLNCVVSQTLIPQLGDEGRALACEALIGTPAIRSLIKEANLNQIIQAMEQGAVDGHRSLTRHLLELVQEKVISKDAALSHAHDGDRLKDNMDRIGTF